MRHENKPGKQGRPLVWRQDESAVVLTQVLPVAASIHQIVNVHPSFAFEFVTKPNLRAWIDGLQFFFRPDVVEIHAHVLDAVMHRLKLFSGRKSFLLELFDLPWPWIRS